LILNNNSKKKKQEPVLKNKNINYSISNFSLTDLKKRLTNSEKKILEYEKERKRLEIEMLKENFYSSNNQKRALEVNVNLKNVLQQIAEEEKNWEKIAENIETSSK
jgi:inactivated superfamily I helicase